MAPAAGEILVPEVSAGVGKAQHLGDGLGHHSFFEGDKHNVQEFVLPEALRFDSAFDNFVDDAEFPVIDLSTLASGDEKQRQETIARLAHAAETWGFFKVVNHGVPLELIQRILEQVRGFFAKPIEEKLEMKSDMPRSYFGYTPGTMITDVDGQHPSWTERLYFKRKEDLFRKLAQGAWPEDDGRISEAILKYMDHMDALTEQLFELLTEGLGVKSEKLTAFHDNTCGGFNVAHYPACPRPELARGLRAHTDPHTMAVLYQEYPGLQLLKDGKWLTVRPEAGTLFVNVGDILQIWSNGRYQSVQHRVALNPTASRYSLIFFKNPRLESVISAPSELIDEAHPRKYKAVSWAEYVGMISKGTTKPGLLIDKIAIA
ncbi:hypothetical protein KC19_4G245100 [Ceratodon purpureus]|uniref:Fe2OG dioxygenase domain-containing protein n=1 Tax=Ceratodon purpureus TaxID=3225 RepID=A0A8T0IFU3_CERPU|nr:hypothetical protein KC19_4G245100 [Ceratodon purpureus]